MNPEWSDFKILLALSRAGSVAGAARELGVDGSTVSRRLSALEDCVGVRLVVRGGREFTWTSEGRAAVAAAETMESVVNAAIRTCRDARQDASGTVRVSFPPAFVPLLIGLMMPAVRERLPLLKLDMSGDFRKVDLTKGEADVALRMVRPSEPGLVARRALEAGWCVFASASYLGTRGSAASLAELREHHLVLYDEALHGVDPFGWMEPYRGTDFLRVDSLEIACQLVCSGTGLAVLPAFFERMFPALLRVFPEPVTFNTGWIVYHESARDTARVHAAADALVEFFAEQVALFSGRTT